MDNAHLTFRQRWAIASLRTDRRLDRTLPASAKTPDTEALRELASLAATSAQRHRAHAR